MATIFKRGERWYAQVSVKGVRKAKSHRTKSQAQAWAIETELLLSSGGLPVAPEKTVLNLFSEYVARKSVHKRGGRWEAIRLNKIGQSFLGSMRAGDVGPEHIARWRDDRLGEVSASSVAREMQILAHVFRVAQNEWRWISKSPCEGVYKPRVAPPRDRRISAAEIEAICLCAGYQREARPLTQTARVAAAFLFAIETAMRAGEIVGLTRDRLFLDRSFARLVETKNGYTRDVALSPEALRILHQVLDVVPEGPVFGLKSAQLDVLFRRVRDAAGIEGLHFHDTRHEAITRLAKRLPVLALARMVGHRRLDQLGAYYNETAEEIAATLAGDE